MADNTDILALLGELLRATDRQTEANTRAINDLRAEMREAHAEMRQANAEMRQANVEMREEFVAIFNRFGEAVADGFIRNEKKLDELKQEVTGVKEEVADLRQDVQRMDQRLERVEANQPTLQDIVRRLTVVETIVLPKAS